jgi:hypothetical protein
MFIPVGCAVTAVEISPKEFSNSCKMCFFHKHQKMCRESPCGHGYRPDGKDVVYILINADNNNEGKK